MLKYIAIIGLSVVLMGCATHQQSNQAVGATVGGVIGHQVIGGAPGAIIGAGVGSIIGAQQPVEQPRIYSFRHQYDPIPRRHDQCEIYKRREHQCYSYRYGDTRAMCLEDARNRYFHCLYR